MDTNIAAAPVAATANNSTNYWPDRFADEYDKSREFKKALEEVDAMLGTPAERARKKAEEKKAQEAKEEREKRIEELYAKLAELRGALAAKGGSDPFIEGEIAQIQMELMWLTLSF